MTSEAGAARKGRAQDDPSVSAGRAAGRSLARAEAVTSPAAGTWRDQFNRLADRLTATLGSAWALLASVLLVVGWALTGPIFGFSDTWQLFINTTTTVITFWMVFVIQNSQNRDARAIHLKLDEIIRATKDARNEFIIAEKATEAEIEAREEELHDIVEADVEAAVDGRVGRAAGRAAGAEIERQRAARDGSGRATEKPG